MDWMGSSEFDRLLDIVEPYEFKELFEMPKLIVNGTIDEFFLPDSWKFYWNKLPDKKYCNMSQTEIMSYLEHIEL